MKHLERVLEISREIRDFVGDADAYGTIAGGRVQRLLSCRAGWVLALHGGRLGTSVFGAQ